MSQYCARCARLPWLQERLAAHEKIWQTTRALSISTVRRQNDRADASMGVGAAMPANQRSQPGLKDSRDTLNIRRTPSEGQQLLRRSAVPPSFQQQGPPPGLLIRRNSGAERNGPPGPVLQRTTLPRRDGQRGGAMRGANNQRSSRPQREDRPQQDRSARRRFAASDDNEEIAGPAALSEEEIENIIDPPQNPTEPLPYTPRDLDMNDLRADWPDTIASPTGAVEVLEQRLQHLARRIPHGYHAPELIAEHYQKGNLTRFESVEEREKVLEHARKLAKDRGDRLTERKGDEVGPEDMSFADVGGAAERTELAQTMVQGVYPELQKQQRPFLDSVVKGLRNNGTYHGPEQARFLGMVRSLLPQSGASGGQPPQGKTS